MSARAALILLAAILGGLVLKVSWREMTTRAEMVSVKAELAEAQADAERFARQLRECEAGRAR